MAENKHRTGFAALVGRPNVGKSTLMNGMIGEKISIMSDRPQTTRNKIMGIFSADHAQIMFLDTPGVHKPLHRCVEPGGCDFVRGGCLREKRSRRTVYH